MDEHKLDLNIYTNQARSMPLKPGSYAQHQASQRFTLLAG
jgi:hypothetical protein